MAANRLGLMHELRHFGLPELHQGGPTNDFSTAQLHYPQKRHRRPAKILNRPLKPAIVFGLRGYSTGRRDSLYLSNAGSGCGLLTPATESGYFFPRKTWLLKNSRRLNLGSPSTGQFSQRVNSYNRLSGSGSSTVFANTINVSKIVRARWNPSFPFLFLSMV